MTDFLSEPCVTVDDGIILERWKGGKEEKLQTDFPIQEYIL